ncbi:MAG TPA: DUF1206 domain-containing protein [Devosia sp.]|jgi:hypothetical protein|nr:DUF1206 domain-containing protein [Devosia sp.]
MQRDKFETFARVGYAARGIVYLLLGGFALTSAFWGGSAQSSSSGALSDLMAMPFGRIMVGLIAMGLLGYVLWRLAQGLLNADDADHDMKGFAKRGGKLISAGGNTLLMLTAARLAFTGGGGGGSGNGEESASAWLLQQPFGVYLLGIVALGVIAAGIVQMWYGGSGNYRKHLSLPPAHRGWMDKLCRFGLIARGVIFGIIGGFLLYAAFTVSPERAGGTAEALQYVHSLPFGPWLYGTIALGLMAFGAYGVIQAFYRHIDAPTASDVHL